MKMDDRETTASFDVVKLTEHRGILAELVITFNRKQMSDANGHCVAE